MGVVAGVAGAETGKARGAVVEGRADQNDVRHLPCGREVSSALSCFRLVLRARSMLMVCSRCACVLVLAELCHLVSSSQLSSVWCWGGHRSLPTSV